MPVCDCCGTRAAAFQISLEKRKTVTRQRLCPTCAEEMGLYLDAQQLPQSLAHICAPLLAPVGDQPERACPECGTTLTTISSRGHVGCPTCYETFETDLAAILHPERERSYRGRLPRRLQRYRRLLMEGGSLRRELDHAVRAEDYEEAARLRDALNSIETEE